MTTKQDVYKIIEQGIADGLPAGAVELHFRQLEKEGNARRNLARSFNAASQLSQGLEALEDRTNSKFIYNVIENADNFRIVTNVPVRFRDVKLTQTSNLHLTVQKSGEITAFGDTDYRFEGYDKKYVTEEVRTGKNGDAGDVLKFVAKKAAQKGLVI